MELRSKLLSLPCMLWQKHIIHSEQPKNIIHGLVKSISCADLFVGQYFIWFGTKLKYVGIQMGTNCAPLVADLSLFCYERDFRLKL